jgi:hypothetical protein
MIRYPKDIFFECAVATQREHARLCARKNNAPIFNDTKKNFTQVV